MPLYRYLPVPSDRMGFLWSTAYIDGVALLEFGPMGTTNFATRHMEEAPIYSTHITDSVLTFGDSRRLLDALRELDERISPRLIFVMQSAATSIIGFDMDAFCAEAQSRIRAKLLPVSLSGLKNDYTTGMENGMRLLMEKFSRPAQCKTNTFNILGVCGDEYLIRNDVHELCRLIKGAFGLMPGLIFPKGATLEQIEKGGESRLSLVLRKEALTSAELLMRIDSVPYLYARPFGAAGTLSWLQKVGELFWQSAGPFVFTA